MHLWHTLLATPMWLKLAVVAAIGLCAVFPAALAFALNALRLLVKTEAGRALLLIVAAILVCQFRAASAYADGRAAEQHANQDRERDLGFKVATLELDNFRLTTAATERARLAGDDRAQNLTAGFKQAEGIAREPRAPVPAVCPEPDPRLLRILAERHKGAEALARELRDLRGAEAPATRHAAQPQ